MAKFKPGDRVILDPTGQYVVTAFRGARGVVVERNGKVYSVKFDQDYSGIVKSRSDGTYICSSHALIRDIDIDTTNINEIEQFLNGRA